MGSDKALHPPSLLFLPYGTPTSFRDSAGMQVPDEVTSICHRVQDAELHEGEKL